MEMYIRASAQRGELELILFGSKSEISADDQERIDAYKTLAQDMGYTLGEYVHQKRKGVVVAKFS